MYQRFDMTKNLENKITKFFETKRDQCFHVRAKPRMTHIPPTRTSTAHAFPPLWLHPSTTCIRQGKGNVATRARWQGEGKAMRCEGPTA
jgi:hypothetical protein